MKRYVTLCAAICFFASCDPVGTDEFHVVNNTSSAIVVLTGDSSHIDTIALIPPVQTQLAFYESGFGRGCGPDQQTLSDRRLYGIKKDTFSCKKDIKQLTNWEIIKVKSLTVGEKANP